MADLPRAAAILQRIAADVEQLARARRVQDLNTAAVLPDPRAERRRRLAEPDLEVRAFCTRRRLPASSTPQLERAWDPWQAEQLFKQATKGKTLHQLRHSRLTHLGDQNVSAPLLMAISGHKQLSTLQQYVKPSQDAVAKLMADTDPDRRRPH
jgi:integrase